MGLGPLSQPPGTPTLEAPLAREGRGRGRKVIHENRHGPRRPCPQGWALGSTVPVVLTTLCRGSSQHPFPHEQTEAQRGEATCPRHTAQVRGGAGCSPFEQQVQDLLGGGEGAVGAQEDGDVGEVAALEGGHQVLHQLLQRACLHRPHLAGLIQVQGRLVFTLGGTERDIQSVPAAQGTEQLRAQAGAWTNSRVLGDFWQEVGHECPSRKRTSACKVEGTEVRSDENHLQVSRSLGTKCVTPRAPRQRGDAGSSGLRGPVHADTQDDRGRTWARPQTESMSRSRGSARRSHHGNQLPFWNVLHLSQAPALTWRGHWAGLRGRASYTELHMVA